jgi:UDP-glucose:(heptosyl)LPS alpha-1,3-glucosyltransferase
VKVALVIERLDPARGGRETSTAQLAEALAGRDCDVTVFCQSADWDAPGVTVRPLGSRGRSKADRLRHFADAVGRETSAQDFDVVHAMLPLPCTTVYQPRGGTLPAQALASRRRRSPVAGRIGSLGRDLSAHRRLLRRWEERLARDPSVACLAGSRMVAEEFEQFYPGSTNVRSVHNAVALPSIPQHQRDAWRADRRKQVGLAGSEPLFLTVATNYRLKGVDCTVRAFSDYVRSGRTGRLVAIGRDQPGRVERLTRRLGLGERVRLLPPTPGIFPWYAAADVVVLLSWYDACSRVILEATCWGIPSITTRFNGAADVLTGGAGIVVDRPDNCQAAAEALRKLTDSAARETARNACRRAAGGLSMDCHVDALLETYREVAT